MARGRKEKVEKNVSVDDIDFDADMEIDPFNLDVEILKQPRLVSQYTSLSATATRNAKLAEEKLKTLRSELVKEAQEKLTKPTVSTIEAYYRTDEGYKEAKQEVIEAQFEADILSGCVSAIHAKRYSLIEAIKLIGMEYFSSPKIPHDAEGVVEQLEAMKEKSLVERTRKALNK